MEGYVVRTVEDGVEALKELQRRSYNLVISDLKMPNMGGLELLEKITEESIPVLTVIMTGFGTVETAIEAMKQGAYDYILKPFKVEEVVHIVAARPRSPAPAAREHPPQGRAVDLQDQRGHRDLAVGREGARPGARRRPSTRSTPTWSACCSEDPKRRRAASSSACARCRRAPSRAWRRRALNFGRGAAALRARTARCWCTAAGRTASCVAARARTPAGQLLLDPAQAQRPHHRHAERLQLHARQQVHRGPAQDAVRAGQPRGGVDRERAPVREPGRRQQGPDHAPTSRWRRTSSRPSSASPTRWRSPTATRAATRSASPCTRA